MEGPLPTLVSKNLQDKLYEKRKGAAIEIEQMVKTLNSSKSIESEAQIRAITATLVKKFTQSTQPNARKGGLIGLAATAIALGSDDVPPYVAELFPPVLNCFVDPDYRVRYYACEALYNVCKVARGNILPWFGPVFDGLCKLTADGDENVRNGAALLDRLVKDLVAENPAFDVDRFVALLRERIYVSNPNVRQLLLSWITVLDSVPEISMLEYLPHFLDGMVNMLSDTNREIRKMADSVLSEFMLEIKKGGHVDAKGVVTILIPICKETVSAPPRDEFTRLTALTWLNEFLKLHPDDTLPFLADALSAALPCLAVKAKEIRSAALETTSLLAALVEKMPPDSEQIGPLLSAVIIELASQYEATRLEALRWIVSVHNKVPKAVMQIFDELFPALLKMLSDPSDKVVRLDLDVLARVSDDDQYFNQFISALVKLFSTDRHLLESRGSLVVRQLSMLLTPAKIYRAFAVILEKEEDLEFARTMVQTLNLILLTSTELFEMRLLLKEMATEEARDLFVALYRTWCHNPVATVGLCLLAQAYTHASDLVMRFADLEITVGLLLEVDKLIQLLESPVYIHVRMHLLEPEKYPYLFKSLYGLLMLLPQSAAFGTLRTRLNCVSSYGQLQLIPKIKEVKGPFPAKFDWKNLLDRFVATQASHLAARRAEVKASLLAQTSTPSMRAAEQKEK